jgi:LysR family nitrogen assimilation transcriptional regulator
LLDTRRLLYFLRIADCGSFSQAAITLGVAQPALSHHMRQLEEYLGTTLLVRRARGVTVTDAGANLLEHARVIVERIEKAENDLRSGARQIVGTVNLGLASSVAASLTPTLVREIRDRQPGIVLRIVEGTSTALAEWIKSERVDLAVNLQAVAQDRAEPLFSEDLYLVGSDSAFGPPQNTEIRFKEAMTYPLVLPTRPHTMRTLLEQTAAEQGVSVKPVFEVNGFEPLKAVVSAGLGYSILSWAAIQTECAEGKVKALRIVDPVIRRTIVLDSSPRGRSSRAATVVGEIVRKTVCEKFEAELWRGEIGRQLKETPRRYRQRIAGALRARDQERLGVR